MHPVLSTSLTQALGCDYPVIQTAMGWVATSQLVIASVEAGVFGFLAAAVMDPAECEAEIQKIKSATSKPFGVNIHGFQPGVERIVDMCIDHEITALSYGRGPNPKIVSKVKNAGLKCVPTIGAGKHASRAVNMGADIVVCQGQEGGGHTGATPTWLLLTDVLDQNLGVPIVACGGFKDGRGLAAALAFGADGVAMGTRFMMSADSPTPDATKAEYIKSDVSNIPVSTKLDGLRQRMILNHTLDELEKSSRFGMLVRALKNSWKFKSQTDMSIIQTLKTAWDMASKTDLTIGQTLMAANAPMIIQRAMVEGKPEEGVLPSGQIAGLIYDLPDCAEIVSKIIAETETNLMRFSRTEV
ncbi:NAD(P)H-dependent flavin oxidoreductase [Microbulbifer sp. 2304DJ12-6]|uniref:NAD(P)H-dependent flavin oxidoreductase n=1 Tax=Microbulbifer sp. 2304DJ12-6 TaxID=3233340 RepID=UPI0039B026C1